MTTERKSLPVTRPEPWDDPPEGFHFEMAEQEQKWITPPVGKGKCRFTVGHYQTCGKPAVVTLMRRHGKGDAPWDYCAEHMYGRWVEDGKVMGWRLVKDEA